MNNDMSGLQEAVKEMTELKRKAGLLRLFLDSEKAEKITKEHRKLLKKQIKHMDGYHEALKQRVIIGVNKS